MKVLVTGSRDFTDNFFLWEQLDNILWDPGPRILIQGGAPGADRMASDWCRRHPQIYPVQLDAKWSLFGKSAGRQRNRAMIALMPDLVLAFYKIGAKNDGTRDMCELARDCDAVGNVVEHWR